MPLNFTVPIQDSVEEQPITVSWDAIVGISYYYIEIASDALFSNIVCAGTTTDTSLIVSGLPHSTSFWLRGKTWPLLAQIQNVQISITSVLKPGLIRLAARTLTLAATINPSNSFSTGLDSYQWEDDTGTFGTKYTGIGYELISSRICYSNSSKSVLIGRIANPRLQGFMWSYNGYETKYVNPSIGPSSSVYALAVSPANSSVMTAGYNFSVPEGRFNYYEFEDNVGFGTKKADLTDPLAGTGRRILFPQSDRVVIASGALTTDPGLNVYVWENETVGTRISNDLLGSMQGIGFTSNSSDIIIARLTAAEGIHAYAWTNGTLGTKYTDPIGGPLSGANRDCFFSRQDDVAFLFSDTSPFMYAWPFESGVGFGTKYANPSTLPPTNGRPNTAQITVAGDHIIYNSESTSTWGYIYVYAWSSITGWGSYVRTSVTGPPQHTAISSKI